MRSQACTLEGALAADRHREEQAREGESACPGGALNGIELKARVYERLLRPARITIVRAHRAGHVFVGLYITRHYNRPRSSPEPLTAELSS